MKKLKPTKNSPAFFIFIKYLKLNSILSLL